MESLINMRVTLSVPMNFILKKILQTAPKMTKFHWSKSVVETF